MNFKLQGSNFHIVGDSNVHALTHAAGQLKGEIDKSGFPLGIVRALGAANEFYVPFYERSGDRIKILNEKMKSRLEGDLCDQDGFLYEPDGSVLLLSAGFHTLVFLNSNRWNTHRHWRIKSNPELQPVSDDAFSTMIIDLNRYFLEFLRDATDIGYRIAVLSSPPATERFIERLSGKKWTQDDILFMDGAVRMVMASQLAKQKILLIEPPDNVTTNGFLRPEFLNDDPADTHHGNIQYSKKFLEKVAAVCGYAL